LYPAALAAACLLAGCVAKGPAFSEAPAPGDRALVYIYRMPNYALSANAAGFDANEKRIAVLDPGGYTYFYAPPGIYDLKQFWPASLLTITNPGLWSSIRTSLNVRSGETHYLRMSAGMGGGTGGGLSMHWEITEVPPEIASREIALEKFQPQDKDMPA
jgi:hypothetical protein